MKHPEHLLSLPGFGCLFLGITGSDHDEELKCLEIFILQQTQCLICVSCWARCVVPSPVVTRSSAIPKKKIHLHLKDDFEYPWTDLPPMEFSTFVSQYLF